MTLFTCYQCLDNTAPTSGAHAPTSPRRHHPLPSVSRAEQGHLSGHRTPRHALAGGFGRGASAGPSVRTGREGSHRVLQRLKTTEASRRQEVYQRSGSRPQLRGPRGEISLDTADEIWKHFFFFFFMIIEVGDRQMTQRERRGGKPYRRWGNKTPYLIGLSVFLASNGRSLAMYGVRT